MEAMDFEGAGDAINIDHQSLLLAAANHDRAKLTELLKTVSATVQDPETGFTPLHAAVAACEADSDSHDSAAAAAPATGDGGGAVGDARELELAAAGETIMLLFQNGAIWNDLDAKDETPGCLARRLGLMGLYELFVQAGVRAELLLETLEEYGMIDDSDEFEDDDGQDDDGAAAAEDAEGGVAMAELGSGDFSERKPSIDAMSAAWRQSSRQNTSYLTNPVTFLDTSLVDASSNGVMMEWETPIMKRHAELLLPKPGLRVLNIGHGLGIIDEAFQARSPLSHHIVEAHPDVLARMKEQGWMDKPGVVVHAGRWQEVLPLLKSVDEDGTVCEFDAIFFDTFAEEYKAFKEFLVDKVSVLMHDKGRFGFFHGMGADRQICYDVYTEIIGIHLHEERYIVEWEDIKVSDLKAAGQWEGLERPYWTLETYKLPTCKFME